VWPRGQRLPRTGRVEIIFHPLRRLAVPEGQEVRAYAQRETEALAGIIKAAL
jgi:hypothetical protein